MRGFADCLLNTSYREHKKYILRDTKVYFIIIIIIVSKFLQEIRRLLHSGDSLRRLEWNVVWLSLPSRQISPQQCKGRAWAPKLNFTNFQNISAQQGAHPCVISTKSPVFVGSLSVGYYV